MSVLLVVHLIALGIWIGVVGAEFFIEFDGMQDDASYIRAAKMHYLTDMWVEIPAFSTVLISGLMMLETSHLSGLFLYKIVFAVAAIFFNAVCVYAVFKRRRFAEASDLESMRSTESVMRVGALIIPTFLIALGVAIYLLVV